MSRTIRIGLAGAGFVARVHAEAYAEIAGVEVACVASQRPESAAAFAEETGVPAHDDIDGLLGRIDIDVVDICAPNKVHEELALKAISAGKHVIVEKPLTGYFATGDGAGRFSRHDMLEGALASADRIIAAARTAGVTVMYAENWIYSPVIRKARRLLTASDGRILEMRGEESHHGSHSSAAKAWADAGGGSLIRLGSHPLGVMLHLKKVEGERRDGTPIRPVAVTCDVADLTKEVALREADRAWIVDDWKDVENWATTIVRFSDGTRGIVSANDICLGGMKDTLDVFATNCRVHCDLSRSSALSAYAPGPGPFADEYLTEKLETKAGWSYPSVDEHWMLGYRHELEDFVDAVRHDRAPESDGELGRAVLAVIYGSYVAAAEGRTYRF